MTRRRQCSNTETLRTSVINVHICELLGILNIWSEIGWHTDFADASSWWMPVEPSSDLRAYDFSHPHLLLQCGNKNVRRFMQG